MLIGLMTVGECEWVLLQRTLAVAFSLSLCRDTCVCACGRGQYRGWAALLPLLSLWVSRGGVMGQAAQTAVNLQPKVPLQHLAEQLRTQPHLRGGKNTARGRREGGKGVER